MKPHQGQQRERMAAGTLLRQIGPSHSGPMLLVSERLRELSVLPL